MSRQIDEKVVSMQFDNKQFESNVKTSMNTIDNLKKSLNFDSASKGFESINKASKNLSLDSIAAGVESLQRRFSTFGIVGMRVIENLTDSMIRLSGKAMNFITEGIIQGGKRRAMNLENAHFQLQGLLKDEEAVSAVMKNVSDSVDGTAYSLDSAAKVASQLAASGMRAGDQMFTSLRAVAGVAAMTNSEYDEIGRIFTQVAGNGRLMGDQLLQLSSRGMNAAATLAEYLGKTESEIRDMVSKGQIDFQTFADAMDNAFGEHAKKANETLTGAFSNVKAALGRIGALFFSPLVEQNGALVQLLNNVRIKINEIKDAMGPIADFAVNVVKNLATNVSNFISKLDVAKPFKKLGELLGSSKWDTFIKKVNDAGISTDKFQEKLKEVASKHGVSIDDLIEKYGTLGKVMSAGKLSKNIIVETLKSFIGAQNEVSVATENVTDKLETFQKVVKEVIRGDFGNGADRMKALADAGYEYASVQKLVNYVWERNGKTWSDCSLSAEELTNVIGDLSDKELKNIGYTDDQIKKIRELAEEAEKTGTPLNELLSSMEKPTGKELIIDTFRNALKGLSTIISSVKKAWSEVFASSKTSGALYNLIAAIHKLSESFVFSEEKADKLKRTFKGLFAAIDIIRMVVGGALNVAFKALKALLGAFNIDLLDVTATVGDAIVKFRDWLQEHNLLKKVIETVAPMIRAFAATIKDAALSAYDWAKNNETLKEIFELISSWISKASDGIQKWIAVLGPAIKTIVGRIKDAAVAVYTWAKNNETLQKVFKSLSQWLSSASESVRNWIDGLKDAESVPKYILSGLVNGLKAGVALIITVATNLGQALIDAIKNVLGIHSPSTVFSEIGENVIAGFVQGIKKGASAAWTALSEFGAKCINIIKSIDFGAVLMGLFTGTVLFTINKLIDVLAMFASPAKKLGDMFGAIGSGIKQMCLDIGSYFKAKKFESISETVKNFAIAIGILTVSVIALGWAMKNYETELWKGFGMIAALSALMAGLTALANKYGKDATLKISATLLSIAGAIATLAFAFKKLGNMTWDQFGVAAASMASLTVFMGALILVTKKSDNIEKATKVFKQIAGAMVILALVSGLFALIKWEGLGKAAAGMAILVGVVALLVLVAKKAEYVIDQVADVLKKIAVAFLMLAVVAKMLGGMSWESLGKAAVGMAGLVVIVGILTTIVKKAGNDAPKIGKTLVEIAGAMALLAVVARIISWMSWESLGKAAVGMAGLVVVVGLLTYITQKASKDAPKIGVTLAAIAGAMAILALTAKVLAGITWDGLDRAMVGMAGLVVVVSMLIYVTQQAGKDAPKIGVTLMSIAGAMAILSVIAVLLGLVKTEHLAKGVIAITLLGIVMAVLINATKNAQKAIGPLITMAAVVGILGGVLYALSNLCDPDKVIASANSLVVALLAISLAMAIVSNFGGGVGGGAALLLASAGLVAIAGALVLLSTIPTEKIGQSLLMLAGALVALCGVAALFSLFAVGAGLMVGALLAIAAVVISVGLGVLAFAGALYVVGLALPLLATGLTQLVTSLAGCKDNVDAFLNVALKLAAGLAVLAIPLVLISVAVLALAVALAVVAVAAIVFAGALTVIGLALPLIANGLTALGQGLNSFVTSVAGCSNSVEGFSAVMGSVSKSILEFLLTLAEGLALFGVGAIVAGAGALVLAAGLVVLSAAVLFGALAVAALAGAFILLGAALNVTAQAVEAGKNLVLGFALGIVESISTVINVVKEFCSGVVNKVKEFLGIHSPSEVMRALGLNTAEGFKLGLDDGAGSVEESAENLGQKAKDGLSAAGSEGGSSFKTGLEDNFDLSSLDLGSLDLESIKGQFSSAGSEGGLSFESGLGENLDLSSLDLGSLDLESIKGQFSSAGSESGSSFMSGIASDVDGNKGEVTSKFNVLGADSGTAFKEGLKSTLNLGNLDIGTLNAEAINGNFKTAGTNGGKSFASALTNTLNSVSVSTSMNSIITGITKYSSKMSNAGKDLGKKFGEGIKSKKDDAKNAGKDLASKASSAIKTKEQKDKFKSAGKYLGDGLVEGIQAKEQAAYDAGYALGQKAVQGEKDGQKSGSPSKLTIKAGKWLGEGLIIGMSRITGKVYKSGEGLGKAATSTISSTISKVADFINTDIDAQPVIRPVVDMSDVTASANSINGMFGMTPSVGVMSNVGAISSMMNARQNGSNNDDVISAIHDLGRKIGESSGDTYSINGIMYDDGSNVSDAVRTLVRAARIERRT